jgi:hypothetical protein
MVEIFFCCLSPHRNGFFKPRFLSVFKGSIFGRRRCVLRERGRAAKNPPFQMMDRAKSKILINEVADMGCFIGEAEAIAAPNKDVENPLRFFPTGKR